MHQSAYILRKTDMFFLPYGGYLECFEVLSNFGNFYGFIARFLEELLKMFCRTLFGKRWSRF